jgi:hypothetical protein
MAGTIPAPTAGDLAVPTVLSEQFMNQVFSGVATLVAGTVTVTAPWVNNNSTKTSKIFVQLRTAATVTLTVQYQVLTITDATSFVIQANIAAGTINVADVSTLMWFAIP